MTQNDDARERLVILGSGWAADVLLRNLDVHAYDAYVVSPVPHFSFTPLLASAAVGKVYAHTLNDGTQRHGCTCYSANAEAIDLAAKSISCTSAVGSQHFRLDYDVLVVAVGCDAADFGTEGAREHAIFFRTTQDAIAIRNRVLSCFEQASLPGVEESEVKRLLHFGIVGGGATGIELTAELSDLLQSDLHRLYPDLTPHCKISVYDVADTILPGFDGDLQQGAKERFTRASVEIKTETHITRVEAKGIEVKELGFVPLGMLAWSTGLAPWLLLKNGIDHAKQDEKTSNLIVDDRLCVMTETKDDEAHSNVFALGDVSMLASGKLPPVGSVAHQQAQFLAKLLNARSKGKAFEQTFHFKESTKVSYLGSGESVSQKGDSGSETGRGAWALWRENYARSLSTQKRISLALNWIMTATFGRDLVRV